MQPQGRTLYQNYILHMQKPDKAQNARKNLRNYRGNGHTGHIPMENHNEKQIKNKAN